MRLWTIQTSDAYSKLLEKGVLYGDWRRVWRNFKSAYLWICQQMELKGISLNKRCPMWAWTHKPDLRVSGHLTPKECGVRLELDVPDGLVLVSNFEAWHCVLNDHYMITTDADLERAFASPCGYSREQVVRSWEWIFDLEHCVDVARYGPTLQATFPSIKLDYVRKAHEFVAR